MKAPLKTRNIRTLLSVFGLATLLLLSPCKVRNFIQAEVGVPQTTVLNSSQTSISTTSCVAFDVAESKHSSSTPITKALYIFYADKSHCIDITVLPQVRSDSLSSTSFCFLPSPLFMCYRALLAD